MGSILEATKSVHRLYQKPIKQASSDLSEFNINEFYYYKIYDSGKFFLFQSGCLELIDFLEESGFITKYPLYVHPKFHQEGFQIEKHARNALLMNHDEAQNILSCYNLNLGVRLVSKTDRFVEEIGFHSAQYDDKQCCFLSNHIKQLHVFKKWFLEQNKSIISFLEESAIDLAKLLGPDFYQDRIHQSDCFYQARLRFIKKLGIETEPKLSSGEWETLKLLVQGYTALQMSEKLFREKRTIEHRIERLKLKLVCTSRSELIQKARELEYCGACFYPYGH